MLKYIFCLFYLIAFAISNAQEIQIQDFHTGKVLNNDTVYLNFYENGFIGWQSLNIELKITNKSKDTLIVGARKREYSSMNQVAHTICFAGGCYVETTFVSPNLAYLFPSQTDSSFSGHYLYHDNNHIPCIDNVSYTFYNNSQPTDSAIVYVQYNTFHRLSAKMIGSLKNLPEPFPNPAKEFLNIPCMEQGLRSLKLYNSLGLLLRSEIYMNTAMHQMSLVGLDDGIYYLKMDEGSAFESNHRIVIMH